MPATSAAEPPHGGAVACDDGRMRGRGGAVGRAVLVGALTGALALPLGACAAQTRRPALVESALAQRSGLPEVSASLRGDRLEVSLLVAGDPDARAVIDTVQAVEDEAEAQDFDLWTATITVESHLDSRLVVGPDLLTRAGAQAMVQDWLLVSDVLLGALTDTLGPPGHAFRDDAGPGLLADLTEASRLPALEAPATWTFVDGPREVRLADDVTADDVTRVAAVQRGLASPSLPLRASTWSLARYPDRVDLAVTVPVGSDPASRTVRRYADRVEPLAEQALEALDAGPRRADDVRWLRLVAADDPGDVFAWWQSDEPPIAGRDRLRRGWDGWLAALARR